MKSLTLFLYEWKHFSRNPFKIVAVLLFLVAGMYGLHNGKQLYQSQVAEIEKIQEDIETEKQTYLAQYDEGKLIDENRPWIDMGTPYGAISNTLTYRFKTPSPAMVYSIGQAEQYGFYKEISLRSSPYDADMAQEIANPERLQTGTLDFAFVLLFLLPLLLLILLYNMKSAEAEQGFLPLIEVQMPSTNAWLVTRIAFYCLLTAIVTIALLVYGALLTDVFKTASDAFGWMLLYTMLYLVFWSLIYFFILKNGKSIMGNSLKMVGIWLLFAFVIPAIVHQCVSIAKPTNLMTDFIEVREMRQELFTNDSLLHKKLIHYFPEIVTSPVYVDSTKISLAKRRSVSAVVNELRKESLQPIQKESEEKNNMIKATYWFNPFSLFQNRFNQIAQTHYSDYQHYRNEIQASIDKRLSLLVTELWHDAKVDKEKYLECDQQLNQ